MKIGDKVTLTPKVMRWQDEQGKRKYESGIVLWIGSYGVATVKFIGINRPICMRQDELQVVE